MCYDRFNFEVKSEIIGISTDVEAVRFYLSHLKGQWSRLLLNEVYDNEIYLQYLGWIL